jgi:hypothetical protein
MTHKIFYEILFLLIIGFSFSGYTQEVPAKNWDVEKIKGVRQLPYVSYDGFPFLTENWILGKIELESGVVIDSLYLKYSSFKDELIYYNKPAGAQIMIDKSSLKGFIFTGADGNTRVFRKLYYDNFVKGDRYFEVLSDGETDLLAFRKVNLNTTTPYYDKNGIMKNMVYELNYNYYFYSPEKGYLSVRMNYSDLLTKFDKLSQKPIRKLLRKNRISITGENSFINAWKTIEKEGYKVAF